MNVLLDTNILTRWINPEDKQHTEAVESLRKLRIAGHVPTLVPQNLYELWVVATRPINANGLGLSPNAVSVELDRLKAPLFHLLQDERMILSRWREIVSTYQVSGKPAHDARLVAAMLQHGFSCLITFNSADFAQ